MTQQDIIKKEVLNILSDGKIHTAKEMHELIQKKNISIKKNSTIIRTIICNMSQENLITRVERGKYISVNCKPLTKHSTDEFTTIIPIPNRNNKLTINILANGTINLNRTLNQKITTRNITIQFSPDYTRIRLIPDGQSSHHFTKAGISKNISLSNVLAQNNIPLPAHYNMHFDKENDLFIGSLSN